MEEHDEQLMDEFDDVDSTPVSIPVAYPSIPPPAAGRNVSSATPNLPLDNTSQYTTKPVAYPKLSEQAPVYAPYSYQPAKEVPFTTSSSYDSYASPQLSSSSSSSSHSLHQPHGSVHSSNDVVRYPSFNSTQISAEIPHHKEQKSDLKMKISEEELCEEFEGKEESENLTQQPKPRSQHGKSRDSFIPTSSPTTGSNNNGEKEKNAIFHEEIVLEESVEPVQKPPSTKQVIDDSAHAERLLAEEKAQIDASLKGYQLRFDHINEVLQGEAPEQRLKREERVAARKEREAEREMARRERLVEREKTRIQRIQEREHRALEKAQRDLERVSSVCSSKSPRDVNRPISSFKEENEHVTSSLQSEIFPQQPSNWVSGMEYVEDNPVGTRVVDKSSCSDTERKVLERAT